MANISGNGSNNNINGTGSADSITAGAGNDTVRGQGGNDTILGDSGNDTLAGNKGDDKIWGGDGNDRIFGHAGADSVYGQDGDDYIDMGSSDDSSNDWASGGSGNDTIIGSFGNDTFFGGSGIDWFSQAPRGSDLLINLNQQLSIVGNFQTSLLGFENAIGGHGDDTLVGSFDDNELRGYNGDDAIYGGGGDDTLRGQSGADIIYGDSSITNSGLNSGQPDKTWSSGSVSGWYNSGSDGKIETWGNGFQGLYTADGSAYIELDANVGGGIDHVQTDTDLEEGVEYIVSFDAAGRGGRSTGESFHVTHNGDIIATITPTVGGFDTYQVTVTGAAGIDTIGFQELASQNNSHGNLIDNVNIEMSPDANSAYSHDDLIYGGDDSDTIYGQQGDDTLYGDNDDDVLYGGSGNDTVIGGAGNDTVLGGKGDDRLNGSSGDDIMTGGLGNDLFLLSSGHNAITDFNIGNSGSIDDDDQSNNDFVNLSGYYNAANLAAYNAANPNEQYAHELSWMRADLADDGVLNDTAAGWSATDSLTIENNQSPIQGHQLTYDNTNVVCFTTGTEIITRYGIAKVEDLERGQKVLTKDHGFKPVRWIGSNHFSAKKLRQHPNLVPVRIAAGALGPELPEHDLIVSQQHRILISSKIARRMFDTNEVLVSAKSLLDLDGVSLFRDPKGVTYYHFLFDHHELVWSNGALTESLYTGPQALKTLSAEDREEIFAIFPELTELDYTPSSCRPLINKKMAQKLAKRHRSNKKVLFTEKYS